MCVYVCVQREICAKLTKLSKYLVSDGFIRDISSRRLGVFERYAISLLPATGNKSAAKRSMSVTAIVT